MIDLGEFEQTLFRLREVIRNEPQLKAFLPAAELICRDASAIASGRLSVPELDPSIPRAMRIPTRELAAKIEGALRTLRPLDGDEPQDVVIALGRVLGNLVEGVTASLYRDYADLIPRTK